jgi:hypothetical protein
VPWHIAKRDDEFCVIKDSDGSTEKCHPTEEQAKAHMRACTRTSRGRRRRRRS